MNSKAMQYQKNTVVVSYSDGEVMSRTESLEDAVQVVYVPQSAGFMARTVRGATVRVVDAAGHPAMAMPSVRFSVR